MPASLLWSNQVWLEIIKLICGERKQAWGLVCHSASQSPLITLLNRSDTLLLSLSLSLSLSLCFKLSITHTHTQTHNADNNVQPWAIFCNVCEAVRRDTDDIKEQDCKVKNK